MIMPVLLHLVVIMHRLFILVLRFFADRTVELTRATTSSPAVIIANVFQASIPSSATYFTALPLSILLALCYGALVVSFLFCLPCSRYFAYLPPPITMFVCESCLSLASRSACLGLLFDVVESYHVTPSTY